MPMTFADIEALRDRMCLALDKRAQCVKENEDWYDGNHPTPEPRPYTLAAVDAEARVAFDKMCQLGVMNWIPPIVDARVDKCEINSLRFGETALSSDAALERIWRRNNLDADHQVPITDALKVGSGPMMLWPDGDGLAEITIEDPAQVIVSYEAGSRRKRKAALKRWVDEDGFSYVNLYLPDWIYKWQSKSGSKLLLDSTGTAFASQWERRESPDEEWPLANPYGKVLVYELTARSSSRAPAYGGGPPVFAGALTDQRRMNQHMFLMLTTEEAQSFRQRWATDWDYPTNDDGTPDREQMLRFAASGMANFSSQEDGQPVRVGEFAQAEFRPFVDIFDVEGKHIAATSNTPPYAFLLGDMVNVAADSLARIEGMFVSGVRRFRTQCGGTFGELLSDALMVEGDPRSRDQSLTVGWIAAEERTATEQATIARTMFDLGAPEEAVWAALPDIDRVEAHRWAVQKATERLLAEPITDQSKVIGGTPGAPGSIITPPATPMERNRDAAHV